MVRSRIAKFKIALLVVGLVFLSSSLLRAQQVPFFVIVNPDNDADMLSREAISDIFLKKTTTWRDGTSAVPIDLDPKSPIREAFSLEIHNRSTANIRSHWQKEAFSGTVVQPLEIATEKEAIKFVQENRGAIAYVSTSASIDGVKLIALVIPPVAIKKVPPNYSQTALRFRIQGDVVLRVLIDEEGKVEDVTVLKELKHGLTEEAVAAVKKWRFQPATSGGMPVSSDLEVTVNFSL